VIKPWNRRRRRGRRDWRFALLVVLISAGAFYATLYETAPELSPDTSSASERPSASPANSGGDLMCDVASVTDGDTLRCQDGVRIRLHAVAARERDGQCAPGHPCPSASAEAATAELRRLAAGKTIRCEPTGRSYNRVTAICWTPAGEEINCAMVRSGTAVIWERFDRQVPLCRS
jgi:endonuclease YncB( thermonuclease family)